MLGLAVDVKRLDEVGAMNYSDRVACLVRTNGMVCAASRQTDGCDLTSPR